MSYYCHVIENICESLEKIKKQGWSVIKTGFSVECPISNPILKVVYSLDAGDGLALKVKEQM